MTAIILNCGHRAVKQSITFEITVEIGAKLDSQKVIMVTFFAEAQSIS